MIYLYFSKVREQMEEQLTTTVEEHDTATMDRRSRSRSQNAADGILEITKVTETIEELVTKHEAGLPISVATDEHIFNPRSGYVSTKDANKTVTLSEAITKKIVDPRSAKVIVDPSEPTTTMDISEAMNSNIMDSTGKLTDPVSGALLNYQEAVRKGLIVEVSVKQEPTKKKTITTEVTQLAVDAVTHPVTQRDVSLAVAIDDGVISTGAGMYINPQTGDAMQLDAAYTGDLIRGEVINVHR